MKIKIILSSLLLFLTYNLSAQVYEYNSILRKVVKDDYRDYTYGKYNFTLNLNNNTLYFNSIGEDIEYIILDYYKLCDNNNIYFKVQGVDNRKNKLTISFNNEDKYIVVYKESYEIFYFIKEIIKKE